jgi:hypothetical protein
MIQRLQTVYLIIIALIAGLLLYLNPSYIEMGGYDKWTGDSRGVISLHFNSVEWIINAATINAVNLGLIGFTLGVICFMAFLGVFLFKNRKLQMMITAFNYIFILLLYIFMIYFGMKYKSQISQDLDVEIAIGLFFPLFLPVFNYMALSRMNYDEQLVRGSSRLR